MTASKPVFPTQVPVWNLTGSSVPKQVPGCPCGVLRATTQPVGPIYESRCYPGWARPTAGCRPKSCLGRGQAGLAGPRRKGTGQGCGFSRGQAGASPELSFLSGLEGD